MSTGNCLIGKCFTHSHMLIIQQETGNLGFSVAGVRMPCSTSRIRQQFSYCTIYLFIYFDYESAFAFYVLLDVSDL